MCRGESGEYIQADPPSSFGTHFQASRNSLKVCLAVLPAHALIPCALAAIHKKKAFRESGQSSDTWMCAPLSGGKGEGRQEIVLTAARREEARCWGGEGMSGMSA